MNEKNHSVDSGWNFDNSYGRLPGIFYRNQYPVPVNSPELIILNASLAKYLGLNIKSLKNKTGVAELSGNSLPNGSSLISQAYAGHQFGHFTMLGDGRAILLGEQISPNNERNDIQLKGSGRTPFSREGDGRATLGPMLREYIISEAMYALGIPTTRSLSVVTTGETVLREKPLPGAILTRTSSSHIRVGTFQYAATWGTKNDIKTLADYTIQRHFKNIWDYENPYVFMLREVIRRQALLISKWQLVGFVHGVMNTDNMSICGETIDYGPCAFMDKYDNKTVFSSIDLNGRYSYGNQPAIAIWNLAVFAETLLSLLHKDRLEAVKIAKQAISEFDSLYFNHWLTGMRCKLGIFNEEEGDTELIHNLLNIMERKGADYTNTFRVLTLESHRETDLYKEEAFLAWYKLWQSRLDRQNESRHQSLKLMHKSNPSIIPRNHRVEEALDSAVEKGDYSVMEKLLKVLSDPYAYSPEQEEYSAPPPPSSLPYVTYCGT